MKRLTAAVILAIVVAGCDEFERTVNDAIVRADTTRTFDRLQQQLGDVPETFDTTAASRLSAAFRAAAARALPAVVQINTITVARSAAVIPGFQAEMTPQRMEATGSGFIFDSTGYILTNYHVVRNAERVNVALLDGREYTAEVVGGDPNTDVAVIRIEGNGSAFPTIEYGQSENVRVGDWVIALGNPMDLTFTATAGIVSAKARSINALVENDGGAPLEAFIQTDAAINPGNSGGPLLDLSGRVIGINTAIASRTGFYQGAGFAIPIDLAKKVASDIVRYGVVHRPRLGVGIDDVTSADAEVYGLQNVSGVEVTTVTPGTPADRAGLQLGDVITAIDGQPVNTAPDLQLRIAQRRPGDTVTVNLVRYGKSMSAKIELDEFESQPVERPVATPRPRNDNPLGFVVVPLPPSRQTPLFRGDDIPVVARVDPISAAARAGLQSGYVILRFNGKEIRTIRDLERATANLRSGQVVSLVVMRAAATSPQPQILNYRITE